MNYKFEIEYRNHLLLRVRSGNQITPEERLWLLTHRIYNRELGYPYVNSDVIDLQTNKDCTVYVKIESITYDERIIPIIEVPGGNGKIVSNNFVTDYHGNTKLNKPIKMLALLLDAEHKETQFVYQSNLGLLGVCYECDYVDEKQKIRMRQKSSTGIANLAMLCDRLSPNQILYHCKNPTDSCFDSLIFSIRWEVYDKRNNSTGDQGSTGGGSVSSANE